MFGVVGGGLFLVPLIILEMKETKDVHHHIEGHRQQLILDYWLIGSCCGYNLLSKDSCLLIAHHPFSLFLTEVH